MTEEAQTALVPLLRESSDFEVVEEIWGARIPIDAWPAADGLSLV